MATNEDMELTIKFSLATFTVQCVACLIAGMLGGMAFFYLFWVVMG